MSIKGKAYVMGAFEHPTRDAPDKTTAQLHAECAAGALADAGLSFDDVDGYFCAGDAPGFGGMSMVDYMGMRNIRHLDSTETGGSSYIIHAGHAPWHRTLGEPMNMRPVHIFFSFYFAMTSIHAIHMLIGVGLFVWVIKLARQRRFSPENYNAVEVVGLYWHFVDIVWILIFTVVYLIQ